jgi:hypothetical protein
MRKNFYKCERCGKKLIERLPNGLWKFAFGRQRIELENGECVDSNNFEPVVEMLVKGSIKMKCIRRECGHYTILPFYPNSKDFQEDSQSA